MTSLITHTLHSESSTGIRIIRPDFEDIKLSSEIIDAVEDVCWDLDFDAIVLVQQLPIVVGESA